MGSARRGTSQRGERASQQDERAAQRFEYIRDGIGQLQDSDRLYSTHSTHAQRNHRPLSSIHKPRFKMFGLKVMVGAALLARGVLGEGVHLFNCRVFGGAGNSPSWLSIVAVRRPVRVDSSHLAFQFMGS